MSFEQSPKLDDFKEILPEPRKALSPRQKLVRGLIIGLGIFVVGLSLIQFFKSDLSAPLRGAGSVSGVALSMQGQPFAGNIFVVGTALAAQTNPDGSFELKNIPAGQRLIVLADAETGREFSVVIRAGQTTDMGTIKFEGTAEP